jgi:hypothetical protein
MKIELKNVKVNEAFSEETTCFIADVFINGKKVAHAKNDGRGGCTDYYPYEGQRELLKQAELFCKGLPKREFTFGDKTHEFDQTLESVIDDLVFAKEKEKEDKKIEKLCENHIVFGKPNGYSYSVLSFKGKPKFADVKKTIQGQKALERLIDRVKGELKEGEEIFNKNLEL